MKHITKFLALIIVAATLFSCVSQQKYLESENLRKSCESELNLLKSDFLSTSNKLTEASSELERLKKQHENLKRDTLLLGKNFRTQSMNLQKLQESYDDLLKSTESLMAGNKSEVSAILDNLNKLKADLLRREDELKMMETEMHNRLIELTEKEKLIEDKEAKISELQRILDNKDVAVNELKDKVLKALQVYQDNGLNVYEKNGKVYVSMDEKLLFKTGSYEVDPRGEVALKEIFIIFEQDSDINVMIEGHTDNVPYRASSGQIRDNWDLSVLRATSVLKIILKHGDIEPSRLTASGRGEYIPIDGDNTPEARAKNRRTEIILTPKMDELFKLLESN